MTRKRSSSWERRRRKRERARGPAPGSRDLLKATAQLASLRSDEEIDAYYDAHPELQAAQADWFHCIYAAARAEQLPDVKAFCQNAWMVMWKFPLSANRYRYLVHDKATLPQRLAAFERVLQEQRCDPAMSARSFLLGAFMTARGVIAHATLDGESRLEEVDGVTVARVRGEDGDWRDLPIVHRKLPSAVTAALELLGMLVDKRIALEALELGFVPGPRGQYVHPASGGNQPVLNQQLNIGMQANAAGMIPVSRVPKATSTVSGASVDQAEHVFHPQEVQALIAQEGRPWGPIPPLSPSWEDHLKKRAIHHAGGPLPYPQKDEIVGEAKTAMEIAIEAKRKEMARGLLLDPAAVVDAELAASSMPGWKADGRTAAAQPRDSPGQGGSTEGSR